MNAPQEQARAARKADLDGLLAALHQAPWSFDFYALMRRVETLCPETPRIGRSLRPSQETLRLGQVAELDFAPAPIVRFEPSDSPAEGDGRRAAGPYAGHLGVRFFGLLGPHGPMPLHLTEYVRERRHQHNDPTLSRFLDIFHHRMIALFYRAWAQTQPTVQMDRPMDDRYAAWLGASFGLGTGTWRRDSVPDQAKLFQAGLLGSRSRHPEAVGKALHHYFGVPVAVRSYVSHWMRIQVEDRSFLGYARSRVERRGPSGAGARLGRNATAGDRIYDRQFKFRVVLGPLTLERYESFLPGGRAWAELRDWVALLAGGDLLWDVRLGLRAAEVPAPRLGGRIRLGLTTWLAGVPRRKDRSSPSAGGDRWELRLRPASSSHLCRPGVVHG